MLPSKGLMTEVGFVIECSGDLLKFSPCSTFHFYLLKNQMPCLLSNSPLPDERALPGDIHSHKLSSTSRLLNAVSCTTHPLSFLSLSLYTASKG
jgi:hypothetical protein